MDPHETASLAYRASVSATESLERRREPRIVADAITHHVILRCTPTDLRILADMAEAALTNQTDAVFYALTVRSVHVAITLDRDRAICERASRSA